MFNLRHKIFEGIISQKGYYEFNENLIHFRGYNFCVYLYSYGSNAVFDYYGFYVLIDDAFYGPVSLRGYEFYYNINVDYIEFLKKLYNNGF